MRRDRKKGCAMVAQYYQINGINLYFTLLEYSKYPANSFFSVLSSKDVRIINRIVVIPDIDKAYIVPKDIGVANTIKINPT